MTQKSNSQPKRLEITKATALKERAIKQEHGDVVELVTGNVFRLRRPNLGSLVSNGAVPSNLAQSAINVERDNGSEKDLKNYLELQRLVTKLALVEPRISESEHPNYDAGEIALSDLTDEEIQEIYMYVQGGDDILRRFREERQRALAGFDMPQVSE